MVWNIAKLSILLKFFHDFVLIYWLFAVRIYFLTTFSWWLSLLNLSVIQVAETLVKASNTHLFIFLENIDHKILCIWHMLFLNILLPHAKNTCQLLRLFFLEWFWLWVHLNLVCKILCSFIHKLIKTGWWLYGYDPTIVGIRVFFCKVVIKNIDSFKEVQIVLLIYLDTHHHLNLIHLLYVLMLLMFFFSNMILIESYVLLQPLLPLYLIII